MTRYSMNVDGVSRERLALAHDPADLRACASSVAVATAVAMAAAGSQAAGLCASLDRFRTVHARALDAVADAAAALGDRLDQSTAETRSVELFVTSSLAESAVAMGGR
ncbi:MAG: hypothetical protein ACKOVB_13785 [Terrabacter sp.]